MFSEVVTPTKLQLGMPATHATSERSIMMQCRLNSLMILHVHMNRPGNLNLAVIANEFTIARERRLTVFVKFYEVFVFVVEDSDFVFSAKRNIYMFIYLIVRIRIGITFLTDDLLGKEVIILVALL